MLQVIFKVSKGKASLLRLDLSKCGITDREVRTGLLEASRAGGCGCP
jgi:hypothetical protein